MQELCRAAGQDDILAFRHSVCLSADVTAAYDPTWASAFEPMNGTYAGRGVAIFKYTGGGSKGSASDACAELVGDITLLKERISPYVNTASLHYLRFPGGSTNTVSRRYGGRGVMAELKQQCAEKGYAYVDWNVCAEDAVGGKPSAGTIYRNVVRETGEQTQCIVLMHDSATTRTTAEALPDIIQWYRDLGFTFCRVEQVLPAP